MTEGYNLFFLFESFLFACFVDVALDNIKQYQSTSDTDKYISDVENRKINQSEIHEIHHVTEQNTVYHIADTAARNKRKSNIKQDVVMLFIIASEHKCDERNYCNGGYYHENPTVIFEYTERRTGVFDICQMQHIFDDGKRFDWLQE